MDKYQYAKYLVALTAMKNINGMMQDVMPAVMPDNGEEMNEELWGAFMKASNANRELWSLIGKQN